MGKRNDLIVERSKQEQALSDAEMDWNNAQADIREVLNPTSIEQPNNELFNEYLAAHRRLCNAFKQISFAKKKIAAIEKELNE